MLSLHQPFVISELTDAAIDATDQAFALGKQDATEGERQDAFIYPANSPAWLAYHEGYKEGSIIAAILNGETRRYWDPANPTEIQVVSWNSELTDTPTYVPFQLPASAYADIVPAEQREEWVGA